MILIDRADRTDAEELLALQKLAYQSEAAIYGDYAIPPLTQTLEEIEEEFDSKIFLNGRIVGSVRAFAEGGTCFIGRLIVHPAHQNKGLGARLMREIEGAFPECTRYELFTGAKSEKNLYLYQKLGYKPYKTEKVTEKLHFVYLEKLRGEKRG
ncbi:MAG: GNAT family N-acetyltransferase [Firmicutes bacterium]|nr:GNAT family N-acetyltransferase [Bacillota bacterium]